MTMKRRLLASLLILITAMVAQSRPTPAPPRPADAAGRPTIGLVLEGGGALGLAHIGVLQWFEDHHIPVDYLAGTSMGGLVGGFYATGMTAGELTTYVKQIQWSQVLRNQTPYPDRSFRRKEDQVDYPTNIEFGLKHGLSLPSGINSGHEVGLILDQVSLPYSDLKDFNDLPTPFRCVATDLVSQRAVVFDKGSLSEALRATMSLPGVFSPVRREKQVFVDGGLMNNLPVDVARRMGADIVIAVYLEGKPLHPQDPLSAVSVMGRSISVMIAENELENMKRADVLITAHTSEYDASDYQYADKLLDLGKAGAEEKGKLLAPFALSDQDWSDYLAYRQNRRRTTPTPQFVAVEGSAPILNKALEKDLSDLAGKPIVPSEINAEMTRVTGLGRFARAGYQMIHRDGQDGLLVRADEKDYAPPIVSPVMIVDGSDFRNVRFTMGARITLLDVGGFGSEWRNDILLGTQYQAFSEYYHPVRPLSRLFIAPRLIVDSEPFDIYSNYENIAEYRKHQFGGGGDFGVAINRFAELRLGYDTSYVYLSRQIGIPSFPDVDGRQGFSRVLFRVDHTNDPVIPRQGFRTVSAFQYYDANPGATEQFPLVKLDAAYFQRISNPASVFLEGSGGTTFGRNGVGLPPFSIGGPFNLSAYAKNELLTNEYFLLQGGYIRKLKEVSPLLGDKLYGLAGYEVGRAYNLTPNESGLHQDFVGALVLQTIFGPVTIGVSAGDNSHYKLFFGLGKLFY
jgi:NTE family protein